jgi:hypothetical protein
MESMHKQIFRKKTMPDSYWPDPLELIELHEAVTNRQREAKIGGRKFTIRYEDRTFFVKPVKGFSPVGHFSYDHTFDEILTKEDQS